MIASEFLKHIATADIDRVTIFRPDPASAWSIYGYGETLPPETINAVTLDPSSGSKRLWSDLEAAYKFVRKSGFRQVIEIDG